MMETRHTEPVMAFSMMNESHILQRNLESQKGFEYSIGKRKTLYKLRMNQSDHQTIRGYHDRNENQFSGRNTVNSRWKPNGKSDESKHGEIVCRIIKIARSIMIVL